MTKPIILLLTVFLLGHGVAKAESEPNEVAREYFEHLQNEEYEAAAGLFDPLELSQLRDMMQFIVDETSDPQEAEFVRLMYGPDHDKSSIRELSDAEFFSGLLTFVMRQSAQIGFTGFGDVQILGYVEEAPNIAHVVARFEISTNTGGVSSVDLVSMRFSEGKWGLLMQADIKALAKQLRSAMGAEN